MKKSSKKISDFKVNPVSIMKELGRMIEQYKENDDSDFWYDRNYFIKQNLNNDIDTYHSTNKSDKQTIMEYDLETINILIQQILRFGRIVYSTEDGKIYNFPRNQIPMFEIHDSLHTKKFNTIKRNMRK
tara:strand:- start:196 stop:582 length:387 start_codon:yes stop_codon:yes gene_type:complete